MPDNGIKFLARGGVKLDDALEREIEARLGEDWDRPTGADVGRVTPYGATVEEYAEHLVGTLDHRPGRAARRARLRERRGRRRRAPRAARRGRRR